MKIGSKILSTTAALAVVATLTACGNASVASPPGSSASSNDSDIAANVQPDPAAVKLLPQSYKDKGELTVAMDLHYPPTTFLAADNKTPIGLNPDIARLLAAKLGLKVEFGNVVFDTIIPGIQGDRYDFTATTMSPPRNG
ncbi:L-cystine-binding protein TcyA (plasmid) [Arthrobacter sp. Hiyo8]|nr:L-cystine-binding protein TcyA [Arthrobacter sp. Hiyo8]